MFYNELISGVNSYNSCEIFVNKNSNLYLTLCILDSMFQQYI